MAARPLMQGTISFQTSSEIHMIEFKTSLGDFTIKLFDDTAPISAANFQAYAEAGFFDGTIFHRVIPGFVIQGGGFTADMEQKKTNAPIKNEATNGVKNKRGTLSMARTNDINSATSQFFVNLVDNAFLDNSASSYGYAVFGEVIAGMDVIDAIAKVQTGRHGHHDDVPTTSVVVQSAKVTA
jgi:cyclophilin family peptidyl-prolyl cis-trans isomerase